MYEDDGAISESGSGYIGEELPGEDMICVPADESAAEVSSIASTLADEGQLQPEAALNMHGQMIKRRAIPLAGCEPTMW